MITAYLDTSAAMKLVVEESESDALSQELSAGEDRRLVASWLLHTEMHCAAGRPSRRARFRRGAGRVGRRGSDRCQSRRPARRRNPRPLRSNDAIHLAVTLRVGCEEIVTYDDELATAARAAGLSVLSPGR